MTPTFASILRTFIAGRMPTPRRTIGIIRRGILTTRNSTYDQQGRLRRFGRGCHLLCSIARRIYPRFTRLGIRIEMMPLVSSNGVVTLISTCNNTLKYLYLPRGLMCEGMRLRALHRRSKLLMIIKCIRITLLDFVLFTFTIDQVVPIVRTCRGLTREGNSSAS